MLPQSPLSFASHAYSLELPSRGTVSRTRSSTSRELPVWPLNGSYHSPPAPGEQVVLPSAHSSPNRPASMRATL